MKNTRFHICLNIAAALLVGLLATGCKDGEPEPLSVLSNESFSGLDQLNIEYNGSRVVGKSATIFQEGSTAYITLFSEVKPSDLSDKLSFMPTLKGPGALPGSPSISIPVYLQQDGQKFTFSGSGKTDFVTYDYTGDVSNNLMDINFTNVKLLNTSLAGVVLEPKGFIPTGTILDDLVKGEFIQFGSGKYSLDELLGTIIQTIAFNADGNAVVTYLKTNDGAPQPAQCPLTMLQYVQPAQGRVQLFVNPTDLVGQIILNNPYHPELPENPFGEEAKPRSVEDETESPFSGILNTVTQTLSEMLEQGIPLEYTISGTNVEIYLDLSPVSSAIMQQLPALEEAAPELVQKIEPVLLQLSQTKLGCNFTILPA